MSDLPKAGVRAATLLGLPSSSHRTTRPSLPLTAKILPLGCTATVHPWPFSPRGVIRTGLRGSATFHNDALAVLPAFTSSECPSGLHATSVASPCPRAPASILPVSRCAATSQKRTVWSAPTLARTFPSGRNRTKVTNP